MAKKKQHFTITNKLTGEVMEFEYQTVQEAEQTYLVIKSMSDILERAKKRIGEYISKQVDDRMEFGDGYIGLWVHGTRKHFRPDVVRKYLDEDQLALVTDINPTRLKGLLSQLVEDGQGIEGAWNDINQNADEQPIKPYFVIRKNQL